MDLLNLYQKGIFGMGNNGKKKKRGKKDEGFSPFILPASPFKHAALGLLSSRRLALVILFFLLFQKRHRIQFLKKTADGASGFLAGRIAFGKSVRRHKHQE